MVKHFSGFLNYEITLLYKTNEIKVLKIWHGRW